MNYWLLIVAIIISIVVLGLVFYFMVVFSSEEDKNQAWMPKAIVVAGLSLACFNVLLLPYDVANRQNTAVAGSVGGGIDTVLMWQIVLFSIAIFCFIIVPFAIFYYEGYDPDQTSILNQLRPAICYTLGTMIVFVTLLIILWLTVGKAVIPYNAYITSPVFKDPNFNPPSQFSDTSSLQHLEIQVSIFVYLVGLMSAVGWVLFFSFGGVGLVALPMDFILHFRDRPQPITVAEYTRRKEDIGRESARLIPIGKDLDQQGRSKTSKKHRKKALLFKRQVDELESAYSKLEISYKDQGGSVLKAWLGLVIGILGVFLSTGWVLHIILNNAAKVTPFLNSFFIALDNAFSLLGTLAYGIFAFYLLWCVVKGCSKVGLNLLIFTIHPMKVNGTMMNAFLFNTLLILIASVSTVQFCAISFAEYAANTSVNMLFTTYVKRLKGINYIVMYLQYPMLGVVALSILWLSICPKRKKSDDDDDD